MSEGGDPPNRAHPVAAESMRAGDGRVLPAVLGFRDLTLEVVLVIFSGPIMEMAQRKGE